MLFTEKYVRVVGIQSNMAHLKDYTSKVELMENFFRN